MKFFFAIAAALVAVTNAANCDLTKLLPLTTDTNTFCKSSTPAPATTAPAAGTPTTTAPAAGTPTTTAPAAGTPSATPSVTTVKPAC
uniref:Uncharacterized protein n=1 Tax=Globisporangium ultimum (strain ATCC 200006 / CBS 805.95 / DAOM BR144) TaxID=431595 RepID=K3WXU8_GLOUD